jgi:predicted ATPase/DNA-binding SARP family transcriptional activator/Tfp pilus assembly protein PilF
MPAITISLLGGFHATLDGAALTRFRGDKVRALLAYLAVEAARPHARSTLAALFWPDLSDDQALNNLSQALTRMRAVFGSAGDTLLHTTRHSVQWGTGASVDVADFVRLASRSDAADLEQAAALYAGELLAGFHLAECDAFEEWLLLTREKFQQLALTTLERLADSARAAGRHSQAAEAARRQLELDPWREAAHRQLIGALAAAGDRAAALAAYERCRQVLLADLGVEPDAATTALVERLRSSPTAVRRTSNLPSPLTPLLGREEELASLDTWLRGNTRLATVVGPGGVGKTRLALAAAGILATVFADGVWWVPLAGVQGEGDTAAQQDQIATAILSALGHPLRGQHAPAHELREALLDRRLLLVLDNCEHLPALGLLLVTLLEATPSLYVLATSRERLGVSGETLLFLAGLPMPSGSAATAHQYPAIELFLARARRHVPALGTDHRSLAGVIRLCHLLDGMPLGIELAAHWVGDYSPDEIAAAVQIDIAFLESRDRDTPDRHRSLRAVFGHSWQLLRADERRTLAGLSVFAGGFDREAALGVAETRPKILAALVDKSLLRRVGAGQYSMHELLRQFAAEQLGAEPGAAPRVAAKHSAWYLAFVVAQLPELMREEPREAAAIISAEIDNVRQAWNWALHNNDIGALLSSANALYQYYAITAQANERERVFSAALELAREHVRRQPEDPLGWRALVAFLSYCATGSVILGRYERAIELAREAQALGHWDDEAHTLAALAWGWALLRKGQRQAAREQLEQALELVERHRLTHLHSELLALLQRVTLLHLGNVYASLNDFERARETMQRALQFCRSQGRRSGEIDSLLYLADLARATYDLPAARSYYQTALELVAKKGTRTSEGLLLRGLGEVARLEGDYEQASSLTERALAVFREIGEVQQEYLAIASLAYLAALMGDPARADGWLASLGEPDIVVGAPAIRIAALLATIGCARVAGHAAHAWEEAEQCWWLAQEYGHAYVQAEILVVLGHTRAAVAHPEAEAAYRAALRLYEQLDNPGPAAEAHAGLAALALERGDLAMARAEADVLRAVIATGARVGLNDPRYTNKIYQRVLAAFEDEHGTRPSHRSTSDLLPRSVL